MKRKYYFLWHQQLFEEKIVEIQNENNLQKVLSIIIILKCLSDTAAYEFVDLLWLDHLNKLKLYI